MSEPVTFSRVQAEPATGSKPDLSVVLAAPTYSQVDPIAAKHLRTAVMHAAANGVRWLGDVSPHRMIIDGARNAATEAAIRSGADGIVWVDDDIVMDPSHITRLLSYGKDFVSGVYFQRHPPHYPLIATFDPEVSSFRFMVQWPKDVLFQADGIGFGFCYTSTKMMVHLRNEHPEVSKTGKWFAWTKYSEDFTMCRYATELGYRPYIDTGILLGHVGNPNVVTIDTFRSLNPSDTLTAAPLVPTC